MGCSEAKAGQGPRHMGLTWIFAASWWLQEELLRPRPRNSGLACADARVHTSTPPANPRTRTQPQGFGTPSLPPALFRVLSSVISFNKG